MIVFTDGQYTEDDPLVEAQNAAAEGMIIYTVTFSPGANQTDMINIANAGNGRHFHADTRANSTVPFANSADQSPTSFNRVDHAGAANATLKNKKSPRRTGATTIEMALVTPLMFLFMFAGMEFSRANMIRNVIENAAFEGARQGIVPGAEAADCIAAAEHQLDITRINDYSVVVDPPAIDQNTTEVTVTVSIPFSTNALPMSKFIGTNTMTRQVTLQRAINN